MKKMGKWKFFALLVGIAVGVTAGISHAATVDVPVTASVQAGTLSLTKTVDLNFGTIIASTQVSTITIAANAAAATPTLTSGNAAVSGGASGRITIGTNIAANVTITYAIAGSLAVAETIDNGVAGAANAMSITNASITANSTTSPLTISIAGPNVINVGGVLQVGINQNAAIYTGTCTVTVNY
ncbi:MAG: DUF4402 domain-containing protein [Desulfamplus sp.]|nr:DUF4402 domain-containing protein [Desulfamplus sp.]